MGATEIYLGKADSAHLHLTEAHRIGEQLQNDTLIGFTLNCFGVYETVVNNNHYAAQHYFMRSIEYPATMASASVNLAQIALIQNDSTGVYYAHKTYQYGVDTENVHYRYIGLLSLVKFAIMNEDVKLATKYFKEMKEIAAAHNYTDTDKLVLLEADILMHSGEYARCNALLDSIKPEVTSNHPNQLPNLLHLQGRSLNKQKRYSESNAVLFEAVEAARTNSFQPLLESTYRIMADNFSALGNDTEAVKYLLLALELSNESAQTERQRMINERDLTLKLAEEERNSALAHQSARYSRILSVVLGLLLVLAVATIVIVIRYLRRRNSLYRHIVQQNIDMLKNEEKYKSRIRQLETQIEEAHPSEVNSPKEMPEKNEETEVQERPITETETLQPDTPTTSEEKRTVGQYILSAEKSRRIFEELQKLMEEEELYRNPQLTRESVMEMLRTNSTYLVQAIKENSGMNYSQYVNSFRIKEAIRILSDKTRIDDPIKEIGLEAGFNSTATFYRLFQQSTGLSPLVYRKSLSQIS